MLLSILKIIVPFALIMQLLPFLIWLERKGAAYVQDRRGPNRSNIAGIRLGGIVHSFSDVVKLLFKEDIVPDHVHRVFYKVAPIISMAVACMTFAVIPFADSLNIDGKPFTMQAADLNVGLLYIFAIASLGVYGIMLAGWSSNNKYSLLGGLRSSAQMVSYEIAMGLSVISVLMFAGSVELSQIVYDQSSVIWKWNFIRMPLAALIFITAVFAESNRLPFDLPEGEAEIVAGYHVEYSSMKFALFFMAEYAHMVVGSAIIIALFFGGWQIPFVSTETLRQFADPILHYFLIGLGFCLLFVGWFLLRKKSSFKWGDLRDKEKMVLGFPAVLAGMALITCTLYFGPFHLSVLGGQIFPAILQVLVYFTKILIFCWVFVWIRWTLPRFRYDQVMSLGWKCMLPLALLNVFVYALILLLMEGK